MFFRGCFCLLLLYISTLSVAQGPYLYFNRISVQNGLSHPKVNCIIEDKRGFIWIGTDDGLNRYDGRYFTVYRHQPGNNTSISGNIINDLLEDEEGILWIATADGGLTKYDYRLHPSMQFRQYKHLRDDSSSIPINIINKLAQDSSGYLWLATDGKIVVRFNKRSGEFIIPVNEGTKNAIGLCIDKNDILWVGKQGGGLLKINTRTLKYEMDDRYKDLYADLPHVTVSSLFRDKRNNIWFGSWDKILYKYNDSTGKEEAFAPTNDRYSFTKDDILGFAEDEKGRFWMAGRYEGLTLYDKNANRFYNYKYDASKEGTIADNKVNCAYVDTRGLVWLGTNKGLSVYNPSQQPFVQSFLSPSKTLTIYDFYKDEKGRLWIGTNEGLFIRDPEQNTFIRKELYYKSKPLVVSKFFRDDDGTMYIGTNFSVFVYNEETNTCTLLPNTEKDPVIHDIINSRVVSISKDYINGHPVLLVSPYGHFVAYYDQKDNYWVSRMDSTRQIITSFNLQDNLIRKFYRTDKGKIWLATVKSGLGEWKNNSTPVVNYHRNDPASTQTISNDNIFDIAEDSAGNLWVSTYGGGLNYFDRKKNVFTHIDAVNNLVEGIAVDEKQNVWLISNGHLHRYDPSLKTFSSFSLPDLEKSGGVKGYIYKDDNGQLYVAGNNYFISFHPSQLKTVSADPAVYLTDFKIFNTSYSHLLSGKNISVKYDQNYFTFEFSAPSFEGTNMEYLYMLEGIDRDWVSAGDRNFASYSNLDGGNYKFRVRTTDKNGNQADNFASIDITIVPPFWKTWYFGLFCVVVAAAIIYGIYRYRINELVKRQSIRNRIAQDLHDNVGSTLSSISVYSQVAKIYKDQRKEDALKDTLERISSTSGEMISEMNDIVWAINPRNDHMDIIVQRMESYAKPLLQAKNISFEFKYDPDLLGINLQMEQRNNFYLIFKEAVNNALKYSSCKHLDVTVAIKHRSVELTVKDDGKGFDMTKASAEASRSLSGNGLGNMKRRAADMRGQCTFISSLGSGTTVTLLFPIT